MINNIFAHFKTKAAFETKLAANEISENALIFIKDTKEIWTHGVYYASLADYITAESVQELLDEKQDTLTAGTGIKIENNEISCTLDTTLFRVVTELPTADIEEKIYIVPNADGDGENVYTEYARVNDAWEKLGEYKADTDLSEYAKSEDVADTYATKDELTAAFEWYEGD